MESFIGGERINKMKIGEKKLMRNRSRLLVEGHSACYHVMSRCVRGEFLFGDDEKEMFRKMIWKQAGFCGVEVLTYAVMSNHFHILVRVPYQEEVSDKELLKRYRSLYGEAYLPEYSLSPKELELLLSKGDKEADEIRKGLIRRMGDLRVFMQELKQRFVKWYNRKHENYGTIWAQRYKSVLIEDSPETLSVLAAYIDLNPVRAEIVEDPAEYRYCGYAESMAGGSNAKYGIAGIWQHKSSRKKLELYRMILFEKSPRSRLTEEIDANKGEISLSEALRCRVRYFSDGMVIGKRLFVDDVFHKERSRFGSKRKSGARRMHGSAWSGLCSMRNLQKA